MERRMPAHPRPSGSPAFQSSLEWNGHAPVEGLTLQLLPVVLHFFGRLHVVLHGAERAETAGDGHLDQPTGVVVHDAVPRHMRTLDGECACRQTQGQQRGQNHFLHTALSLLWRKAGLPMGPGGSLRFAYPYFLNFKWGTSSQLA